MGFCVHCEAEPSGLLYRLTYHMVHRVEPQPRALDASTFLDVKARRLDAVAGRLDAYEPVTMLCRIKESRLDISRRSTFLDARRFLTHLDVTAVRLRITP